MPMIAERARILEQEFPEIRSRLLQLAAALDRIDRAGGSVEGDPRLEQIRRGMELLPTGSRNRAEQLQLIFSRPYQEGWRAELGISRSA